MQRGTVVVDALPARPPDVLQLFETRRGQDDRAGPREDGPAKRRERSGVCTEADDRARRRHATSGRLRLGAGAATEPQRRRFLEDPNAQLQEDAETPALRFRGGTRAEAE